MSAPATRSSSRFDSDVARTIPELKRTFAAVLDVLKLRRAVDLQKALKLDRTLSWQIVKVAGDLSDAGTGKVVPSRVSVEKFVSAALVAGVESARLEPVLKAYADFESLVEKHAGDRTSFNSLITASDGPTQDWCMVDLQHRRNIYRGVSHAIGIQVKTRLSLSILARSKTGSGFDTVLVSGLLGMRSLRRQDRVRVHAVRSLLSRDNQGDATSLHPLRMSNSPTNFLLADFSSQPLPPMETQVRERDWGHWIATFLVNPEVGNTGVCSVVFGMRQAHATRHLRLSSMLRLPAESMVHDVLIEPGLMDDLQPKLEIFAGEAENKDNPSDTIPLEGDYKLEHAGKGPDALALKQFPEYSDLIRAAAEEMDADINAFDALRVQVKFPVYQSTVRIAWDPKVDR